MCSASQPKPDSPKREGLGKKRGLSHLAGGNGGRRNASGVSGISPLHYNANKLEKFVGGENKFTTLLDFCKLRCSEVGWQFFWTDIHSG